MAETYWPFDAGSGSSSGEDRWYKMAPLWSPDGPTTSGGLAVTTLSGRNLQVATGEAYVHGAYYVNDAAINVPIAANASGNPRIDRVVLRRDLTANTVAAVVVQGTAAASPAVPALTQVAAGIWEVPLARYRAESGFVNTDSLKLTDERALSGAANLLATLTYTTHSYSSPNLGDFSSASLVDYITGLSVPVPAWARDGAALVDLRADICHAMVITTSATFAFRLVADSTNGTTVGGFGTAVAGGIAGIPFGSNYTVPAGATTVAVKIQAQRTTGSGALRVASGNTPLVDLRGTFHR